MVQLNRALLVDALVQKLGSLSGPFGFCTDESLLKIDNDVRELIMAIDRLTLSDSEDVYITE